MPLIIKQRFPLGRFHSTRWNQNPFEDPYGEWPPSPWRFLRALAARWIQYSRETGDDDEQTRDELIQILAKHPPSFRLPPFSWRGIAIRQYQPTKVEWSDKNKKNPGFKKPAVTLVHDHFRTVSPIEPVYWFWEKIDNLDTNHSTLLYELLRRITYFGRAESFCRFEILNTYANIPEPNCILKKLRTNGHPVLVVDPNCELDLEDLFAATDDKRISSRRIPPGSAWFYADIPERPNIKYVSKEMLKYPANLTLIQFAIGGRVYPPIERWVKVTERFRGLVLRISSQNLTNNPKAKYHDLTEIQKDELKLLSGKDGKGQPLEGHQHAYFFLMPDDHGNPTRLICYRKIPFTPKEIDSLLAASSFKIAWESGSPDWYVRLVPLPFEVPTPVDFCSKSQIWKSLTPFVLPGNRYRFRRHGKERPGETPVRLLEKLLDKLDYPKPVDIEFIDTNQVEWVYIHASIKEKRKLKEQRTQAIHRGYRCRITFAEPVIGPISLGHSSHYGLGLFVPCHE